MNKLIILTFYITSLLFGGNEEKTHTIDLNKSKLRWVAKKLTGSHWGSIRLKSGIVKINNNLPIAGEFIVDMKTIEVMDTNESIWGKKLQSHLHSKDFFDTENYPEAKLSIKKVTMRNGKFIIDADLSIKSIMHPIEFVCEIFQSGDLASARGKMEIDRTLYDVTYRSARYFPNIGDRMIYDIFTVDFEIDAK
jgi:polyisoprenoid-binding protein YceI